MPIRNVRCPRCGSDRLMLRSREHPAPGILARLLRPWRTRRHAVPDAPLVASGRQEVYLCELCGHIWPRTERN